VLNLFAPGYAPSGAVVTPPSAEEAIPRLARRTPGGDGDGDADREDAVRRDRERRAGLRRT
jgi:hypothetical protein